jgi:hypothetical protein
MSFARSEHISASSPRIIRVGTSMAAQYLLPGIAEGSDNLRVEQRDVALAACMPLHTVTRDVDPFFLC